ncbi:MAG TPA: class I SAM-dependent methyltransferase [Steroidobacteraceae bacterium]|nr:class I SAM-dependent methyltransferase [Steroidobacteraceae bacterium]
MSANPSPRSDEAQRKARALFRRARLEAWLGRRTAALALCREAVERADYSRAYTLMSQLSLPGEDYFRVLARIHRHLRPRTYLEIGVSRGDSLGCVLPETQVLGIDPAPNLTRPAPANVRIYRETSDNFFARYSPRAELGGAPLELAFIDGMHHFEYALRDFLNIERSCSRASVILLHDCYPLDERTARREQVTGFWSGDIWRLMLLLRAERPDLVVRTIATPPTGLGIVLNPDPGSRVLGNRLDGLIAEYLAKDFSVLAAAKADALGLLENRWPAIRALLDGRPKA